ncbi:MAG: type II secretion system F family protein [Chloroflexi bacterium]|nr:type II secretion system F family protein [Chloroflexota bacterium]
MKLTPAEFWAINGSAVILAILLGFIIFRVILVALPFGILGYIAPRWYLGWRQTRRRTAFAAQLPDAITLLANSIRSGSSLPQSMELISRESQPPIAEEFGRVIREIGLGLAIEPALNNMARRIRNDDLDLMVTAILVQHEVGGNLAQILEIIGFTIRERIRIKGEINVLTAQQKGAGYLVGSMPLIVTVILFLINPVYMSELFNSVVGEALFCTSFGLVGTAFLLIRKIVNIEL